MEWDATTPEGVAYERASPLKRALGMRDMGDDRIAEDGTCSQCGYSFAGHGVQAQRPIRCPECGFTNLLAGPEREKRSAQVVLDVAVIVAAAAVLGGLVQASAIVFGGAGHGSALPMILFNGPATLLVFADPFAGVLVSALLFVCYAVVVFKCRKRGRAMTCLWVLAGIHYCSVLLVAIWFSNLKQEFQLMIDDIVEFPWVLLGFVCFALFHLLMWYIATREPRSKSLFV